jgi:nitrogen fixation NifU-like protein
MAVDTELYLDLILDHYRNPRNYGTLPRATHRARGHNPLCGDRVSLELLVENGTIVDLKFEGAGCAISTASASLMTEAVKGKSLSEAEALFDLFHHLIRGEIEDGEDVESRLGKLSALSGVRNYPVRVKCATLPWHALKSALENRGEEVSTE